MFDRLSKRIKNIKKDLNFKVANDLCSKFDNIIISHFGFRDMVLKNFRKWTTKTVR